MPNQVHNCTVWLIQYSYAVDYYFMIYTAHFFAFILPRKVQYMVIKEVYAAITIYTVHNTLLNAKLWMQLILISRSQEFNHTYDNTEYNLNQLLFSWNVFLRHYEKLSMYFVT